MINNHTPTQKDSQFAINIHYYINNIIASFATMYKQELPEGVHILRIGYIVNSEEAYVPGSVSKFVRSDTEEELFRIELTENFKPILYLCKLKEK